MFGLFSSLCNAPNERDHGGASENGGNVLIASKGFRPLWVTVRVCLHFCKVIVCTNRPHVLPHSPSYLILGHSGINELANHGYLAHSSAL